MSVKITVQFSEREAEAILRADGFDNGWGARKSQATRTAAFKVNEAILRVLRDRDDTRVALDEMTREATADGPTGDGFEETR